MGSDTLDGGAGNDTASYASATAGVELDLTQLEDQLTRGAGVDTLVSIENLIGSTFNDLLIGDQEPTPCEAGAGMTGCEAGPATTISTVGRATTSSTVKRADLVYGDGGADTLSGGDGHDSVWGGAGDDVLEGGWAATPSTAGRGPTPPPTRRRRPGWSWT